jgi:cytochrome P450
VSDDESKAANRPPLHDPSFHAGDPFPCFRRLRATPGLYWHETPGFWAVTRHADVTAISRDPATFCSSRGTLLSDLQRPIMPRQSIIYIDPPEHVRYRKLAQPAFSPGRLRLLEGHIRDLTRQLLDTIEPDATIDFVEAFAAQLPILVIAHMLGVPAADHARFKQWSDAIIEAATEQTPENSTQAAELLGYFSAVIAERRTHPTDDIISTLVHSEIDGERLEEFDLLMFCMTLLVAGNETTRNLIAHGTLALATHPDQRALLLREPARIARAVDEMLRWGSPIGSFMRTATRDVECSGTSIRAGERLLMLYASANRDESTFGPDAEEFRVTRDASRHVAFGFGEHFCMGAALAQMEGRIAFEEIFARFSGITLAGPVERVHSVLIRGIARLPVVLSA